MNKQDLHSTDRPQLRLPRLLSDGMILQMDRPAHLWGWAAPGAAVTVLVDGEKCISCTAGEDGRFDCSIPAPSAGAGHTITFSDGENSRTVRDVLAGRVFFCTGQSNMELPMERVKDRYPEEMSIENPLIRTFKITEAVSYDGPLEENLTGKWTSLAAPDIAQFSATALFFAKVLFKETGTPVGLINATLGGSRIESWMSREMLEGYDELLSEADRYADKEFYDSVVQRNLLNQETWLSALDEADRYHTAPLPLPDGAADKAIHLPVMFRDTELKGFTGSIWLQRDFYIEKELCESPEDTDWKLWLGTMVDKDEAYVNGVPVGRTEYQYPPRKYPVPGSLLKSGRNILTVRLTVEQGLGRVTPGKPMAIFPARFVTPEEAAEEKKAVFLDGEWKYTIGAACGAAPETDFVNWKATGLYNAMTAPCHNYVIEAVLWYQGESNTHEPWDYRDLTKRQIAGYRKLWNDPDLPYYYVQLPNFVIDQTDPEQWPVFREKQRRLLEIPGTGMAVTFDAGEDNDLHPVDKKPVGERLARLVLAKDLHMPVGYTGPVPVKAQLGREAGKAQQNPETGNVQQDREAGQRTDGFVLDLFLTHAAGMYEKPGSEGELRPAFEALTEDGTVLYPEKEELLEKDGIIRLWFKSEGAREGVGSPLPVQLRYLFTDTNHVNMIFNSDGLPMSPFILPVEGGEEKGHE